jgi:hypothetical protein
MYSYAINKFLFVLEVYLQYHMSSLNLVAFSKMMLSSNKLIIHKEIPFCLEV